MPLLMDLKCPVEFCGAEVTRDSAGHAQAYLTFLNLSDTCVEGVHAMVTLEDERGQSVDIRPLRYRGIRAPGRSRFSLCIAAEKLPYFENARVLIHQVWMEGGASYRLDEDALMDCTVCQEPPGEARAALIGVAGEDAVCYASQGTAIWICLCGRYNENSRNVCIRCGRSRREVLALTPARALEGYEQRRRRESEELEAKRINAHIQENALRRRRRLAYARCVQKEKRRTLVLRMGMFLGAALLVWILTAWIR